MDGSDFIVDKKPRRCQQEQENSPGFNFEFEQRSPTDMLLDSMESPDLYRGSFEERDLSSLLPQSAQVARGQKASRANYQANQSVRNFSITKSHSEQVLCERSLHQCDAIDNEHRSGNGNDNKNNNNINVSPGAPCLDFIIDENDNLSNNFMDSLKASGLARNNTITSIREKVVTGPSESPQLFERLRKARNKVASRSAQELLAENDFLTQQLVVLPTPVLNAISFTPASSDRLPSPHMQQSYDSDDCSSAVTINSDTISTMSSLRECEESKCPSLVSESAKIPQELQTTVTTTKTSNLAIKYDQESIYQENFDTPSSPIITTSPTLNELDPPDTCDRGRLFLKFEHIRDLRLPMDSSRNQRFTLTLDNGLQTVTTAAMSLAEIKKTGIIPIEQEFELLVGQDLELIITLNAIQDPPRQSEQQPIQQKRQTQQMRYNQKSGSGSEVAAPNSPKKKRFGFFSSPKKKASAPLVDAVSPSSPLVPPIRDPWADMLGPNGEFSRAYIVESQFESEIYGKKQTFIVSCFNEWTVKRRPITQDFSTSNKKSLLRQQSQGVMGKKDPYRIGGLQVSMLYIPKFHKSEEIPKSMKHCLEELELAYHYRNVHLEGFLSQQGGDCSFWRRRWFMLKGSILIGHHEQSRKPRIEIDMSTALEMIEFSNMPSYEIDVPCINEDRAFRISFKDKEPISFYADSIGQKDDWLKVLHTAMLHCSGKPRRWTDLVLSQQQETDKRKAIQQKLPQMNQVNSSFIEEL